MNCADCHGALTDVAGSESLGLCASCAEAQAAAAESVRDLDAPSHDFGAAAHDIASAHRVARALMTESWLWNLCDDGAPLGSDTGADTLSAFREWRRRHRTADPSAFQAQLLQDWEVPDCGLGTPGSGGVGATSSFGALRHPHPRRCRHRDCVCSTRRRGASLRGGAAASAGGASPPSCWSSPSIPRMAESPRTRRAASRNAVRD